MNVIVNAETCVSPCEDKPVQLTGNKGTIYSPGYDDGVYPNNAHCRWLIKASRGYVRRNTMGLHYYERSV